MSEERIEMEEQMEEIEEIEESAEEKTEENAECRMHNAELTTAFTYCY